MLWLAFPVILISSLHWCWPLANPSHSRTPTVKNLCISLGVSVLLVWPESLVVLKEPQNLPVTPEVMDLLSPCAPTGPMGKGLEEMVLPRGEVRRPTVLHLVPSLSWACRIALLMGKPGFVWGCGTILCSFLEGRTRIQLQTRGRRGRGKRSPTPIYSTCHFLLCDLYNWKISNLFIFIFWEAADHLLTCWKLSFIHTCCLELIASSSWPPCLLPRSETKSR